MSKFSKILREAYMSDHDVEQMGRLACQSGRMRDPRMDKKFMDLVSNLDANQITQLMKAWLNGWDMEKTSKGKLQWGKKPEMGVIGFGGGY